MNNSSSEVVMFTIAEKISSFLELKDKISDFEKANFVQLYIRHWRFIEEATKCTTGKQCNGELKYSEIEYSGLYS